MAAEMAGVVVVPSHVLVKFAQKLASNERKHRDAAVKKLRRWLAVRSQAKEGGFSEDDMLKIWKGLHYCMWMCDKMTVQEDLAENMSQLIHGFKQTDTAFLFLAAFLQTMGREWFGIDRLRLEKFMMLFRRCLHQGFVLMKLHGWEEQHILLLSKMLTQGVINGKNEFVPDGLKYHMADIFVEELAGAGANELEPQKVFRLLQPYCHFLGCCRNHVLVRHVVKQVFEQLYQQGVQAKQEDDEEKGTTADLYKRLQDMGHLQIDHDALATQLMKVAAKKKCYSKNRPIIYRLVKKFQGLAQGILSEQEEMEPDNSPDVLDDANVEKAIKRLQSFENEIAATSSKTKMKKNCKILKMGTELGLIQKKKKNRKEVSNIAKQSSSEDLDVKSLRKLDSKDDSTSASVKLGSIKKKKKHNKELTYLEQAKGAVLNLETGSSLANGHLNESNISIPNSDKKNLRVSDISDSRKRKHDNAKSFSSPSKTSHPQSTNNSSSIKILSKQERRLQRQSTGDFESPVDQSKASKNSICQKGTLQEEVEIWIPNKKYKGKLKGFEEKKLAQKEATQMQTNMGFTVTDTIDSKNKLSKGSELVKFEKTPKIPAAFVKKAFQKVSCHSEPRKCRNTPKRLKIKTPLSAPAGQKKVSFVMSKNKAQDYGDYQTSLGDATPSPFDPKNKPSQGILKSPATGGQLLTPRMKLFGSKRRAKAADFF